MIVNKYKPVEQTELTTEQKENSCWRAGTASGSRVKEMLLRPMQLYDEWTHGTKKHFNDSAKQKMRDGTDWEEHCIDVYVKQYNEENPKKPIKIDRDKRTFVSTELEYCYANIDGFISPTGKIEDMTIGIEIKTTSTQVNKDNPEQSLYDFIKEYYISQVRYYMWFFNVKKWTVIIFHNWHGYAFTFKWEEEIEHIEYMVSIIQKMHECWEKKILPDWSHIVEVKEIPVKNVILEDTTEEKMLKRYFEVDSEMKRYEAEKEGIKIYFLQKFFKKDVKSYNELEATQLSSKDGGSSIVIGYNKKRDTYQPLDKVIQHFNKEYGTNYSTSDFVIPNEGSAYSSVVRIKK